MHKVFVYGTLRSEASNSFRMKGARSLGKATIQAKLYRVHKEFPGRVLSDEQGQSVRGEIFSEVSPEMINALDVYEGCDQGMPREDRIYSRVVTEAKLETGEVHEVFVWEYSKPVLSNEQIKEGDWLEVI